MGYLLRMRAIPKKGCSCAFQDFKDSLGYGPASTFTSSTNTNLIYKKSMLKDLEGVEIEDLESVKDSDFGLNFYGNDPMKIMQVFGNHFNILRSDIKRIK